MSPLRLRRSAITASRWPILLCGLLLWSTLVDISRSDPQLDPSTRQALAEFVDVEKAVPGIIVDLRYATEDNVFGRKFYPSNQCFLHREVAKKLALVQTDLESQGFGLKIWDGFRPLAIQRELWEFKPDPRYVADPAEGSRHNRGAAVDVTLVDGEGAELAMPTPYDTFGPEAHARYIKVTEEEAANRKLLQEVMTRHGFEILDTEWWHFDAAGWEAYPILDVTYEQLLKEAGKN